MPRADALALARPDDGIDLIEISAAAMPPVVRLMSYDKFRYEEEKRIKKERAAQKTASMKAVQITAKAAHNDLMVKVRQVEKFFAEGHPVEVVMRLRGREAPYPAVTAFRRLIPEPHPDIVVPETNVFLPLVETNRDDPENSLVYLFDTAKQLAVRGSDTPDVASRIIQGRSRARILPFDPYAATHSHFYVVLDTDVKDIDAWQFKYLLNQMHATFRWLGSVEGWSVYSVDLKPSAA